MCVADRVDIDQEDWPAIHHWVGGVVSGLEGVGLQSHLDYLSVSNGTEQTGFSRTQPFMATLSVCNLLSPTHSFTHPLTHPLAP